MSTYLTDKLPQRIEFLVFGYIRMYVENKPKSKIIPLEIKHLCGCFAFDYDEWDDINSSKDYKVSTDKKVVKKICSSFYTIAFGTRIVNVGEICIWSLKVIQCGSNTLIIGILPSKSANSDRASMDNKKVGHPDFPNEYSIDISNGGTYDGKNKPKLPFSTNDDIYNIKLDLCDYKFSVKRNDDQWVVFYDCIHPTSYRLAYSTYYSKNGFEILHQ
eukprot:31563_1